MTYNELVQYYQANVPQDPNSPLGTNAGNDRFNNWTSQLEKQLGIPGGQYDDPSSGWSTITPDVLNQFETTGGNGVPTGASLNTTGGGVPLEQGLLQTAVPNLVTQATVGDAARQAQLADLTRQTNTAYGNLGQVLQTAQGHFDGVAYLRANPDVAANYAQYPVGQAPSTRSVNGTDMTPDQFAQFHYDNYGKNEGRAPTFTSDLLQAQNGNVNATTAAITTAAQTAAASNLSALQTSIGQMQQNLTGNLAAKAGALQQAVATFTQNLNTLDASQRQSLAAQIATQQRDLEASIAAQKQALATEVQQLQGNSSAAAQARMAALSTELQTLTAAEAPMAQARLQGAEALATAVNLGLESTKDQLTAQAAQQGFTGGSTMQDAALARATVGARQDAAQAIAGAKVANASDLRDVTRYGANKNYSIADVLAGEQQQAGNLGATGGAQLSAALAQGTQGLGDLGATGLRSISDTTAGARANIGNSAATQTYTDTVGGADQNLTLQNNLSQGTYNLANTLAGQIQGATNQGALARAGYFDQLFPTTLNAAQVATQLPGQQAATLSSLLPYGNAGLTNAQNALNWWSTSNNPPSPTATLQQPSTAGNGIAAVGSGLLGTAFNIGNSNRWWQTPNTPAAAPVGPAYGGT